MRPSLDSYLMRLAEVASTRTTCIRRGVGCVLADKRGRVLSIGYNGVASEMPHCSLISKGRPLASVKILPKPKPAQLSLTNTREKFYFERVWKENPKLRQLGSGVWKNPRLRESSVPGEIGVTADYYPYVCTGHDLPPGQDSCEAIHAEQNALLQCPRPDDIWTAYVTLSPCKACAKLLMNTGCQRILFLEQHVNAAEQGNLWLRSRQGREWQHYQHTDQGAES